MLKVLVTLIAVFLRLTCGICFQLAVWGRDKETLHFCQFARKASGRCDASDTVTVRIWTWKPCDLQIDAIFEARSGNGNGNCWGALVRPLATAAVPNAMQVFTIIWQ